MHRDIYIVGNWKMNTTLAEAMVLAGSVARQSEELNGLKIILAPPAIWLVPLRERFRTAKLAAQNMYSLTKGPYTGEMSATMLKGIAKYVILGHSERRTVFNEDDMLVNAKVRTALRENITPILAIGEEKPLDLEGLTDRGIGQRVRHSALYQSLKNSTTGLKKSDWEDLIIAYEPVWAIGAGHHASGVYAARIIQELRGIISDLAGSDIAKIVPILYGGSVSRHNAPEYAGQKEIDGVLVGEASLKARDFTDIAEAFAHAYQWRR
jgi:triosephosphate isomerase